MAPDVQTRVNLEASTRPTGHLPKLSAGIIVSGMFRRIDDFEKVWTVESKLTLKVLHALTDEKLSQSVTPGSYTLGSLAWHVATSIAMIPAHAGLLPIPDKKPMPETVDEIIAAYEHNVKLVRDAVQDELTDAKLEKEVTMFGRTFRYGTVLSIVISHQCHHRGQMTVLLRQAGLKVPGVYGPSEDEAKAAAK